LQLDDIIKCYSPYNPNGPQKEALRSCFSNPPKIATRAMDSYASIDPATPDTIYLRIELVENASERKMDSDIGRRYAFLIATCILNVMGKWILTTGLKGVDRVTKRFDLGDLVEQNIFGGIVRTEIGRTSFVGVVEHLTITFPSYTRTVPSSFLKDVFKKLDKGVLTAEDLRIPNTGYEVQGLKPVLGKLEGRGTRGIKCGIRN